MVLEANPKGELERILNNKHYTGIRISFYKVLFERLQSSAYLSYAVS